MHKEILTTEQVHLLPLVQQFAKDFYLVGGTAIAFHIGHRRSIDFDLFTFKKFENNKIKRVITKEARINTVMRDEEGQYTLMINHVQMTFFQCPFLIPAKHWFQRIIKMPDLLTLAAMKAYALGRRAKWKDYVDLYFIMKKYHGATAIVDKARTLFGKEFNEKLFREQLSYFQDINYAEKVVYMPGFEVSDKTVERALLNFSVSKKYAPRRRKMFVTGARSLSFLLRRGNPPDKMV